MNDYKEVIFISDIHFGVKNASIEWMENIKDYFDRFFIPLVGDEVSAGNKPCVVVAGDYFDCRQHIDIQVMNDAYDVMKRISKLCDVYMMVGNHDIYKSNSTDVTSLKMFEDLNNVNVVSDTFVLDVNGKKFCLVSWIGDFSKENKFIANNIDKYDYLVFHTELSGMVYDNNRPIVNGLNIQLASDDCRILSGHIHKRQESKKGMYFGSPYQLSRSDIGNQKGIYIFRCQFDGTVERVFIENNVSPVFLKVKFSDVGKKAENWENIIRNNYVDIVFDEDDLDSVNTSKFVDGLQKYSPKKIEFSVNRRPVEQVDVDVNAMLAEENVNIQTCEHLDTFVEDIFNRKVNGSGLSEEQLALVKNLNVEYLKKAAEEISK